MSKARLVLTALFADRQSPAEVAARYGLHRSWVYKLKARHQADGDAAFEPRSRRPKTSPTAIPPATVALIVHLRQKLTTAGLDAGPDTIAWHLAKARLRRSLRTVGGQVMCSLRRCPRAGSRFDPNGRLKDAAAGRDG